MLRISHEAHRIEAGSLGADGVSVSGAGGRTHDDEEQNQSAEGQTAAFTRRPTGRG